MQSAKQAAVPLDPSGSLATLAAGILALAAMWASAIASAGWLAPAA